MPGTTIGSSNMVVVSKGGSHPEIIHVTVGIYLRGIANDLPR